MKYAKDRGLVPVATGVPLYTSVYARSLPIGVATVDSLASSKAVPALLTIKVSDIKK